MLLWKHSKLLWSKAIAVNVAEKAGSTLLPDPQDHQVLRKKGLCDGVGPKQVRCGAGLRRA
jgi:hypothetical protein